MNAIQNVIQNLIADLREKRLWPVAVGLIVALIAVPVLLSGAAKSSAPAAQIPPTGSAPVAAVPAVSVTATPSNARLTGAQRDPFKQQKRASATSAGSKAAGSSSAKSKGSSSATGSTGSPASGAVGGSSTTVTTTPTTTTTPAAPTPAGLTANEAYHVTVSTSYRTGNLNTIDPVERLSLFPSDQQPLLIELGVLKGGHRVLFAVRPGTVVRGPGKCTPGPIDCEILSLAPNQIEWVGTSGPSGVASVALMAVTAITAGYYPSSAAADQARAAESPAGHRLLGSLNFAALSLFQYKPSLGALVDLSNVTVGGS